MYFTYEQKLQMCIDKDNGFGDSYISRKYGTHRMTVHRYYQQYKRHGPDIFKRSYTHWTKDQKECAVKRVMDGESITSVAIDLGINPISMLNRWIKRYKENGYTIVERKRGKPPMNKSSTNKKENLTKEEYLKQLEKENLELRIENEYLKKLDALVSKRKAQQQKKKLS